ncbi:MAG: 2Fe-2S iron-sulfur cluster-binding protein [Gemmatimonadetes bacterium]|jgi:predicted molibdopterin-dependent oxidoreductase YjgC|nr:2Fe-2S iron-sulfur cluster-binding protein [Gemmatimonadota bacterium]
MSSSEMIGVTIDGRRIDVPGGTTIWEAARRLGVDIPVLCHDPRLEPVGVCRICLVDIGEKKLTAACVRRAEDEMEVRTSTPTLDACRRGLVELLLSDYPCDAADRFKTAPDELLGLARDLGVAWPGNGAGSTTRARTADVGGIPAGGGRPVDDSSKVISVDHQACILCDRCIRACDDIQVNEVIGRTGKGYASRIAFDLDVPMGESTCVACGECEKVCPTGALSLRDLAAGADGWERV